MKTKTRNRALAAALSIGALTLVGCGGRGMIRASVLQGVMDPVLDRHDTYVQADGSLTPVEQETFLRSSELLRQVVDTAVGAEPAAN